MDLWSRISSTPPSQPIAVDVNGMPALDVNDKNAQQSIEPINPAGYDATAGGQVFRFYFDDFPQLFKFAENS